MNRPVTVPVCLYDTDARQFVTMELIALRVITLRADCGCFRTAHAGRTWTFEIAITHGGAYIRPEGGAAFRAVAANGPVTIDI